jgi:hypothetical protein
LIHAANHRRVKGVRRPNQRLGPNPEKISYGAGAAFATGTGRTGRPTATAGGKSPENTARKVKTSGGRDLTLVLASAAEVELKALGICGRLQPKLLKSRLRKSYHRGSGVFK